MDTVTATEIIAVIRTQQRLRFDRLDEDPDFASDQWLIGDVPFINEMCLILLVAIRHQVERELVLVAARANTGSTITHEQYQQNVVSERRALRGSLITKLDLASFPEWGKSMKTLQLLANSLKHNPWQQPDEELLKHLKHRLSIN